MIQDLNKFSKQLTTWLQAEKKRTNKRGFVVPLYGEQVYAQTALKLCQDAAPTYTVEESCETFNKFAITAEKANRLDCLIVGVLSREEILARSYKKYSTGLADIFPLGELYHSEIVQLYNYLCNKTDKFEPPIIRDLSAVIIEWADKENRKNNIIYATEPPNSSRVWFRYTIPQKEALSKLHQFEKLTQHKKLSGLIYPARSSEFIQ